MNRSLIKTLARLILPASAYRRLVFSRVYSKHIWGRDEAGFFSGGGSRGEPVRVYVDALAQILKSPETIVDLGCGDFAVGRELLRRFPKANYIGCDIVPQLIRHHQHNYASDRASFRLMDIVAEPIPSGDVYLVRQVFQHLSNDDITHVLHKLQGSPCVIVTEGQPSKLSGPKNRDKTAGGNTRFDTATGSGSGVYLDEPPFSLNLQELCRVEIAGTERIITWRVVQQEHTTERRS